MRTFFSTYIHTYKRTCIHAHTFIHAYKHTHVHTAYIHTCTQTYIRSHYTYIHEHTHTHAHKHTHDKHSCKHTPLSLLRACVRACACVRVRARVHACACVRVRVRVRVCYSRWTCSSSTSCVYFDILSGVCNKIVSRIYTLTCYAWSFTRGTCTSNTRSECSNILPRVYLLTSYLMSIFWHPISRRILGGICTFSPFVSWLSIYSDILSCVVFEGDMQQQQKMLHVPLEYILTSCLVTIYIFWHAISYHTLRGTCAFSPPVSWPHILTSYLVSYSRGTCSSNRSCQ